MVCVDWISPGFKKETTSFVYMTFKKLGYRRKMKITRLREYTFRVIITKWS